MKTDNGITKTQVVNIRTDSGWVLINPLHISDAQWLPNKVTLFVRMASGANHIISGKQAKRLMSFIIIENPK